MSVRIATRDDAAGIAGVHIRAWQQTYAALVEPGELDDLPVDRRSQRWTDIIDEGRTTVYVAEVDDSIVGFASAGSRRDHEFVRPLELEALYVLAEYHGTGVGQSLLDAAIGDVPAFLFVAERNPRATRFYERNRFVFDGVEESFPLVRTPVRSLRMVR